MGGIHTARSVVTIVCSLCCHHLSLQCSTNQKASRRLCSKQVFSTPRKKANHCSLHASRTSFAVVVPESLHTSPAASTLKNPCCGPMRSQEDRTTAMSVTCFGATSMRPESSPLRQSSNCISAAALNQSSDPSQNLGWAAKQR